MDPAVVDAIVQGLNWKASSNYITIFSVVVMVYDYVLNFQLEVTFIWFSSWKYTNILYLLVRYLALLSVYFNIYLMLLPDTSIQRCNVAFIMVTWVCTLSIVFAEAVLMIRTWAVWNRVRTLGFVLLALFFCAVIVVIFTVTKYLKAFAISPTPFSTFDGCYVTLNYTEMPVPIIAWLVIDTVLFILMVISAYRTYNLYRNSACKLWHVIHRDGIFYYIYFLVLTVVNVALLYSLPNYHGYLFTLPLTALYSVLTCRVILNIRKVAGEDQLTALHESGHPWEMESIEFADNVQLSGAPNAQATVLQLEDSNTQATVQMEDC